tara:strand:- start:7992 stop:8642 length:651 start_codon:yes stop_codon:yes gene_type:complete
MSDKVSILLVEDDVIDAEMVERALLAVNPPIFSLHHTNSFRNALREVKENTFHLVILDLGLPDNAGLNGVEQLLAAIPTIPIVVLTGQGDDDTAMKAIELGAQEFLDKSEMTPQQLVRCIRHAAKRKQCSLQPSKYASTIDNRSVGSDLALIIHKASNIICSRADTLMKTKLTAEQKSLVSEIEDASKTSAEDMRRLVPHFETATVNSPPESWLLD